MKCRTSRQDACSAHHMEMRRLAAQTGKLDWDELPAAYGAMLAEGLGVIGPRGKHVRTCCR